MSKTTITIKKEREDLLNERYRPVILDDTIGLGDYINDFKEYTKQKEIPNLIFSGEAGLGKTTCAMILAYEIAGKGNTKIIDASVNNGIDVMRTEVKDFAMRYGDTSSNLKIIIFDEADNISFPAQQALRRTLEKYSKYIRCIFTCNYIRKIIDPIQSRCIKYTFKKIKDEDIFKRLKYISNCEKIKITDEELRDIIKNTNGDLRKSINTLDVISKGASSKNFIEKEKNHDKIFIQLCLKGELLKIRNYVNENISDSHEMSTLLINSLNIIIDSVNIPPQLKYDIINLIGECEYRLTLSSNFYLCSQWLCANIYISICKYKENNNK